ncbi:diguanylate cyclase [Thiomicrorhabdus sp. zzn3]|uniref:sensor domain-containing diguanylate cyclase n=1 Tax=Thiomicrorhabdus sp. zzn3 TaxID=3039775 RepID=UPI002436776F|nr:diguanylate cyclase [Thiomicrorhabdus sp. zzn3]MDG6778312.1 diguanylate cyclase [Thiomicrorhabdus sp. zzn3]
MIKHEINHEPIVEGELSLFRTLWRTSHDNMFIVKVDVNGDYISEKSNRAMEMTFGLNPGQLDGVLLKDMLDDSVYKKIAQRYDRCISMNVPITYEEEHEIDDMGLRVWSTTILPVVDKNTGITRILGVSREITSLKKAEVVLKEHNEQLEQEVRKRTEELRRALEEMESISIQDKLTGLYNRHKLDTTLLEYINLAHRYYAPFGLIILDLDNFKEINDAFGHYAGDKLLKGVSERLKKGCRKTDVIGRWGGDEFMILVPKADRKAIMSLGNHLRDTVQDSIFDVSVKLTISIGMTLYEEGDQMEDMILRADQALYESKRANRNQVTFK